MAKLWTLVILSLNINWTLVHAKEPLPLDPAAAITKAWNADLESIKDSLPKAWKKIKMVYFYTSHDRRDFAKSLTPQITKDSKNGVYKLDVNLVPRYEDQKIKITLGYQLFYGSKQLVWELTRDIEAAFPRNPFVEMGVESDPPPTSTKPTSAKPTSTKKK